MGKKAENKSLGRNNIRIEAEGYPLTNNEDIVDSNYDSQVHMSTRVEEKYNNEVK